MLYKNMLILCAFLSTPSFVNAQAPDKLMDFSIEELLNIKVSSASNYQELEKDAPAIINKITRSDIKRYGFRNMYDALSFQAGFSILQDSNERMYSQRGIYGTTTQKILFNRDGLRLNNTLFNSIASDNTINMKTIDNIEVLRGAAGSIYGDMAMTGVVSINSIKDKKYNGVQVGVGVGSFGAKEGDVYYKNDNLLTWGHYFTNDGDKVTSPASDDYATPAVAGTHVIDHTPDNFEVGVLYETKKIKATATYSSNKRIPERSAGGQILEAQDLATRKIFQKVSQLSSGIELRAKAGSFDLELLHFYNRFELNTPQVLATTRTGTFKGLELDAVNNSYGIDYRARISNSKHTFLTGIKIENNEFMKLKNTLDVNGTLTSYDMPEAAELRVALYAEEKYKITDNLTLNAGLRYDIYEYIGSELSPRFALTHTLNNRYTFKFVFAHSFLSPLFFNRNSNPALGYGSTDDLKNESSDSYQLVAQAVFDNGLSSRLTLFKNTYKNIVKRSGTLYVNQDKFNTFGLEAEFSYKANKSYEWFTNYSLIRTEITDKTVSAVNDHSIKGYPAQMLKGGFSYTVLQGKEFYISPSFKAYSAVTNQNLKQNPGYVIYNINFYAKPTKSITTNLGIYNLSDKVYKSGGSVNPYPQSGRSFKFNVSWKI